MTGSNDTINIGGRELPIWPQGQEITSYDKDRTVQRVHFDDFEIYHSGLLAKALELGQKAEAAGQRSRSLGGAKIYAPHEWGCPEADLVEARVIEFFRRAMNVPEGYIDLGWANMYSQGDYVLPHSHVRATASLVYMLAPGEADPRDPDSGLFTIVDPRYAHCCEVQAGCMTNPVRINLQPGTMIMFPGQLVHCVNAYGGKMPRITMSWNVNREVLPGDMLASMRGQQA